MEYNSQKPKMILPAYGRLVQQMVERALQEPDRQKRQAMAEHIVQVMARLRPAVARSADGRQMLWDDLAYLAKYQLDIDTMVLWTLHQCYGWGAARLKKFYVAMMKEHLRMREFYELDDLYPERHKLKEKGVDVEAWYDEFFDEKGNFKTSGDAFDEPTDEEGKKN